MKRDLHGGLENPERLFHSSYLPETDKIFLKNELLEYKLSQPPSLDYSQNKGVYEAS